MNSIRVLKVPFVMNVRNFSSISFFNNFPVHNGIHTGIFRFGGLFISIQTTRCLFLSHRSSASLLSIQYLRFILSPLYITHHASSWKSLYNRQYIKLVLYNKNLKLYLNNNLATHIHLHPLSCF